MHARTVNGIIRLFSIIPQQRKHGMSEQLDTLSVAHNKGNDGNGNSSRNTLRYIILGLLGARPMSGYDIKQAFDRALASYWNAGNSQIYTTLKSLSDAKLVEAEVIVQKSRPDRKVYHLTPAGQAELDRWLQEDVPERFSKDDFLKNSSSVAKPRTK